MNGADALIQTLVANEVTACFANPGTSEMQFVSALDRQPAMRPVLCLFEGVATGAADGYGRIADRPACTLLHLGPGYGNGLANLHNARRAYTPVVNVVGDHATYHRQYDAPLNSDIPTIVGPNSLWVKSADTADSVAAIAAEAIEASYGPPGGPVSLILPADAAWTSLLAGLPQRAQGITIPEGKLLAAHRQAWHLAGIAADDPLRCLIAEADPVRRVALATAAHKIPKAEFSGLIADAFARAAPGARAAIAVHLFETCTVGRLSAAVAEQIGAVYACIGASPDFVDRLAAHSDRYKAWKHLRDHLSRLDPENPEHQLGANALVLAFKGFEIKLPADVDIVWDAWTGARQVLAGGVP